MLILSAYRFRSVGLICWFGMLIVCAQTASAQLTLKLSLLDQQVTEERSTYSAATGLKKVSIQKGEPVSIRLELFNSGNAPVRLLPSLNLSVATSLYLVEPSGKVEPLAAERWAKRDVFVKARSFAPKERIVYETFLFGRLLENLGLEYLFPETGSYKLYAKYVIDAQDGSLDPALKVESNRVEVTVGPPLPGWNELKAAGIVDEIEGRSRSEQEHAARLARLRAILAGLSQNPYAPWLTKKSNRDESQEPQVSVDPKIQADVEATLRAFLAALAAGDTKSYAVFLSMDFRNEGLNRRRAIQELDEDIQKLKGAKLDIQSEIISVIPSGVDMAVTARLVYRTPSSNEEHLSRFTMRKDKDTWLIRRWDRLRQ